MGALGGGYSGVNFGHPKSEVFQNGGGGYSEVQFQKGVNWRIWTKIYCSARNLLVHHSSLSHTTYVETNKQEIEYMHLSPVKLNSVTFKTVGKCYSKYNSIQECIPVGCIPSAAVAVFFWGGGCLPRGCLPGGGLPGGGVCLGGCLPRRGVHPLPPVDRIDTRLTHAWENITLPQLLLRTVTILQTSTKGLTLSIFLRNM